MRSVSVFTAERSFILKYHAVITGWGDEALRFLEDPEANFIILFNDDVPPELAEVSVLHTKEELFEMPSRGDSVIIGDKVFEITAVGEKAKTTLKDLGHCTFVFKGKDTPDRPGCIMLQGDKPLLKSDIQVENTIEIY